MQIKLLSFLCVLMNSVASLLVLFPLIRNLGYHNPDSFSDLLPFVQTFSRNTNSVFLFAVSCCIIFVSGFLYYFLVIRRLNGRNAFLEFEAFISLVSLVILQQNLPFIKALIIPIIHIIIDVLFVRKIYLYLSENKLLLFQTWLRWVFYSSFAISLLIFLGNGPFSFVIKENQTSTLAYASILLAIVGLYALFKTKYKPLLELSIDIFVIISIALFTTRNDPSYFDYSIIIGPLNDIIKGKDIGANVVSIYGFIDIYVAALVFRIFNISDYYTGLSYIISFFYFLGYSTIYLFLRFHTKNFILSLLTITYIININFNYTSIPIHWLPQVGFFRFGVFLPIFIILYFLNSFKGKFVLEWLMALPVALMMFWLPELGLYIFTSIFAVFLYRILIRKDISYIPFLLKIFTCIALLLMLICCYIYLKYGHLPIWSDYIYYQKIFATYGIAMYPFTSIGTWILPPLIYFACIYICLENIEGMEHSDAWLFLSFFGLQSMLYYAGKQGVYDLPRIILPAVILVSAATAYILKYHTFSDIFKNSRIVPILCYSFVSFAVALSWNVCIGAGQKDFWLLSLPEDYRRIIQSNNQSSTELFINSPINLPKFKYDASVIKLLVPDGNSLAILSKIDTLYYVETQRKSLFKNASYPHFFLGSEMKDIADAILVDKTKYIFVDNSDFQIFNNRVSDHARYPFIWLGGRYAKVASLNFVDVYQRKN